MSEYIYKTLTSFWHLKIDSSRSSRTIRDSLASSSDVFHDVAFRDMGVDSFTPFHMLWAPV